uniref:Uracil phosphoribosyltransferase n=1 Tax=Caloglossa monosticha TaxID=76906 RepID=A0A1Z1M5D5_9FLOR|nr:uracil phosphoribosyltransferase [Caloglossa monosticha]ARW61142.1 uracil phosphoribosyltransferase [Caloglossa monosticha]
MQLNIYLISHPITQILSNSFTYQNINIDINENNNKKYLSLLLFYEIMRKNLKIKNIYVKQILKLKTIYLPDFYQQNYIITDLSNTYFMISEIKAIIPNFNIINIDQLNLNYNLNDKIIKMLKQNQKIKKKIIIFETILIQNYILELIESLIKKLKINAKEINIACLVCNNQILNEISQKYPKLNVYTTKIIL